MSFLPHTEALKAYLMAQGEEFIVTPSIARLCDEYDKGFLALKKRSKR